MSELDHFEIFTFLCQNNNITGTSLLSFKKTVPGIKTGSKKYTFLDIKTRSKPYNNCAKMN